ncbi:serine/threonine protein kinase [Aeoliella sp. ICT_H6.2]|uniref:Serine/threonine protein kinase n=1 Tax=Aeoliella straminimaris TaxID=2954799 RepID=A0A9X2FA17_9BACT|nr:serine/threonine-protein kinase [Aeoliella straminimaris]MCO6045182.1 serine/threonine protein kinase [Aeoliella straminimaris]
MNLATETRMGGTDHRDQQDPPPSPAEIANWFPKFEIEECLGRGGMGVVYKARQKTLDREVAIKILAGEWKDDAAFTERFEREAKILAQMSHPNIVTVHDFGKAQGLFYLVMEYVDGVNLRDLLSDGKIAPEQALAIVPPICEALEYAHSKGIVHRDIKPENLLLDRDGRVKIADFGIASLVGATSDISGTPSYMAPEQANGSVDRRTDIYALGVVLYEMLTGERPEQEIIAPSKKVQVDVKIDEMVLRALEKEPERRYQTAREFQTTAEYVASASRAGDMSPMKSPAYNPWELTTIVMGTLFSLVMLFVALELPEPLRYPVALCFFIAMWIGAISLLGIWPQASPLFPAPNFSSRNMPHMSPGAAQRSIPLNRTFGLIIGVIVGVAVFGTLMARGYLVGQADHWRASVEPEASYAVETDVVLLSLESDEPGPRFLDLDTGQTRGWPEMEHESDAETRRWMNTAGVELFAEQVGGRWGLVTRRADGLKIARVPADASSDITAEDLRDALAQTDGWLEVIDEGGPEGWRAYLVPDPLPPGLPLAFRTADGALGLLQINAQTSDPQQLELQLKVYEDSQPKSQDES